ncbi:hypothetical protein ABKT97_14480 [Enterobacter hormaechei]
MNFNEQQYERAIQLYNNKALNADGQTIFKPVKPLSDEELEQRAIEEKA